MKSSEEITATAIWKLFFQNAMYPITDNKGNMPYTGTVTATVNLKKFVTGETSVFYSQEEMLHSKIDFLS